MNARRISFGMIDPPREKPVSKYRAKPTFVDGFRFDSKREAERWSQLQLLLKAGRIRNLERQVTYRLEIMGVLICKYRADFTYEELQRDGSWSAVTEDVKGYATDAYKLKKKMMKACHGIEVRES
jgi:hypothetical protein